MLSRRPNSPSLNKAVLAACDALDGVTDGLLTDPHQCHFDPATLLCRGGDGGQLPDGAAGRGREDGLRAREAERRAN